MTRIWIGAPERIAGRPTTWIIFRAAASNADPEKRVVGQTKAETAGSGLAHGRAWALIMIDKPIVMQAAYRRKIMKGKVLNSLSAIILTTAFIGFSGLAMPQPK
jgi:hypothetical protein